MAMDQETDLLELSGTVEAVIYKNEENGYTVLEFSSGGDLYTAVGELSDVNVGEGRVDDRQRPVDDAQRTRAAVQGGVCPAHPADECERYI